jgi:hypothetical protein
VGIKKLYLPSVKLHTLQGKCKLGWFKSSKNPNPKCPYKVYILTLKWKKTLKTNVERPYVVINQLMKSI